MQRVKSSEGIQWFQPQSRFTENHYNKTKPSMVFDSEGKLQEHNHVTLKSPNNKQQYYLDEYLYSDGSREKGIKYSNFAKERTRYCNNYDIIKNESISADGANKKISWDYTTQESYGIGVVKEKKTGGQWVAKIYQKCNYSHPEDHQLYDVYLKERAINPESKFCKAFKKDILIFDSTKKYSEEQINELLKKFKMPKKAITIIKKALIH